MFDTQGLIFGSGGQASVHYCDGKFSVSTDCFLAQVKNPNEVYLKYVYYFLLGNLRLLENGFRGAGLKHISKDYISQIRIPLPPLETQKKIAAILDKADELRQNDKKILEKYDQLAQSVFLEMFGDPFAKKSICKVANLADKTKGSLRTGPFGSDLLHSEFTDSGIAVLGIDNVVDNRFSWKQRRYISIDKYAKLKRYTVKPNDVLITIMGTIGRSAVVPNDIGTAINTKHLAAITVNPEVCNPLFLSFSLHSDPRIQNQLKSKGRGAIMTGLNLTIIKDLNINLPSIEKQNKFAEILTGIEKQKAITDISIKKSEDLFQSLLQRAFRGEL
jgi:type I restriction enzyme S subunit